jgi:glutamate carboxypeptidase
MDLILNYLQNEQNSMLAMLRRFVEAESPSTDKASVDRFGVMVGNVARRMGGRVRFYDSCCSGNHLRAEFRFDSRPAVGQILLLGHLDTVWELGTLRRMPFRIVQGRAFGPGSFDMKSGIVSGMFALKALHALKVPVRRKVIFLLTADEEMGSKSSRRILEKEACRSDLVLVLEPAQGPDGALKTARKGVGEFEIRVKGRSAHAGLDPEMGANAIVELSRQILRLEQFADRRLGITVNTGIVTGGSRTNVVASEAVAKVDVRIKRTRDMEKIKRRFYSLRPYDRRTKVETLGGFNRPPLERTAQVAMLFNEARRLARSLGISLTESSVGGASDGNFTAALGVPTLDGLGAVGDGAHAIHENIVVRELPRRAALLAHLIAKIGKL